MKASDIALVAFVAMVSALLAYWLGGMFLGDPNEKYERIDFATEISNTVVPPDDEVFNPYAKNPTVEVMSPEDCNPWEEWDEDAQICQAVENNDNPDEAEEDDGSGPEAE